MFYEFMKDDDKTIL